MYNYHKAKEDYMDSMQKKSSNRLPLVLNGTCQELPSRKISKETCEFYNYQVGSFSGVIKDNIYTDTPCHIATLGQAQKLRLPDKTFAWAGAVNNGELFGQALFPPNKERAIIVTEGELDALSVYQATGYPAISLTCGAAGASAQLKKNLDWLYGWKEVRLWFDKDEPGEKALQDCALLFDSDRIQAIITPHPYKDASDLLQNGEVELIKRAYWNPQPIGSEVVRSAGDLETYKYADDSSKVIAPWAWPSLTHKIKGYRAGITVLIADPGIGKSTFGNTNAAFWAELGLPSVIMALEDSFKDNQKKIVSQFANKDLIYLEDDEYYKEALPYKDTASFIRLFDKDTLPDKDVLERTIKLEARARDCKIFILDNLTYLIDGLDASDPNKKTAEIMTMLREVTKALNVGVLLIVHTTTPKEKDDAIRKLTVWDSLWSKSVGRYGTMMLGLERNREGPDTDVWVKGLKDRAGLAVGYLTKLRYNGIKYIEIPKDKQQELPNEASSSNTTLFK